MKPFIEFEWTEIDATDTTDSTMHSDGPGFGPYLMGAVMFYSAVVACVTWIFLGG